MSVTVPNGYPMVARLLHEGRGRLYQGPIEILREQESGAFSFGSSDFQAHSKSRKLLM